MYNNFISEKKRRQQIEYQNALIREENMKKKYLMKVQPALLGQYEKRINSFIQQMQQKTSKVQIVEKKTNTLRNFTFSKSQTNFNFSSNKSLITKSNSQKTINSSNKISTPSKNHEFRQRKKSKQLDGYMKFGLSQQLKPRTPKQNQSSKRFKRLHKQQHNDSEKAVQMTQSIRNTSRDTIRQTNHSKKSAFFNLTIKTSDYFREEISDNIERQARQYEKQQQFVEKGQHFKRLLGISLTSKNKQNKTRFRNILQKSGYIIPKYKRDVVSNGKQLDRLSQIIDSQIEN